MRKIKAGGKWKKRDDKENRLKETDSESSHKRGDALSISPSLQSVLLIHNESFQWPTQLFG